MEKEVKKEKNPTMLEIVCKAYQVDPKPYEQIFIKGVLYPTFDEALKKEVKGLVRTEVAEAAYRLGKVDQCISQLHKANITLNAQNKALMCGSKDHFRAGMKEVVQDLMHTSSHKFQDKLHTYWEDLKND